MLRSLNVAPSSFARNKKWFMEPWLVEKLDTKFFAYVPTTVLVVGEDSDCEVLRHNLALQELRIGMDHLESTPNDVTLHADAHNNDVDDLLDPKIVAKLEARDVIQSMLDIHEPQVEGNGILDKVVPFVEYDGHVNFKST